ncbi:MAG TPA: hypothetical protein VGJ72_18465 [Polaromonas sp.]
MNDATLFLAALVCIALLNAVVSVAVARSGYYSGGQVAAQVVIVWLIPVLGAVVVGVFLWSQRAATASTSGADPENWQNAEDSPHTEQHGP